MFEAYITNAALYPEAGVEVGTTLKFPATTQEVQAALAKIGIDGKQYTEVFFTSFDSDDVLGLYDYLYEYAGIDELNELAHTLIGVRNKGELEKYEAALVLGKHTESVKDLINLAQNLDLYRFYPDISNEEELGRLYADEFHAIEIPEHIQNYFDCLPFSDTPENGAKKQRLLLANLRFSGFLEPFGCGLHDNKLFFVHGV